MFFPLQFLGLWIINTRGYYAMHMKALGTLLFYISEVMLKCHNRTLLPQYLKCYYWSISIYSVSINKNGPIIYELLPSSPLGSINLLIAHMRNEHAWRLIYIYISAIVDTEI